METTEEKALVRQISQTRGTAREWYLELQDDEFNWTCLKGEASKFSLEEATFFSSLLSKYNTDEQLIFDVTAAAGDFLLRQKETQFYLKAIDSRPLLGQVQWTSLMEEATFSFTDEVTAEQYANHLACLFNLTLEVVKLEFSENE